LLEIVNTGPFSDERYLWSGQRYFLQSQRHSAKDQRNQQVSNGDCQAYESCRPTSSPTKKIFLAEEQLIYELRKRKLGHRRIQIELNRLNNIALSTATIYKVLLKLGSQNLKHKRKFRKHGIRSSRRVPGDRAQTDVCKIALGSTPAPVSARPSN
jgi:hypothetical protein